MSDSTYISGVVEFDRPLLGDISGLDCVHLQCHIGTDTLSLARLGARSVTGLDFSGESISQARLLAQNALESGGRELRFVQADVYSAPEVLVPGSYDLVFTGIGSLCWLPSIVNWAGVVYSLLKPGGRLFIREGHPVLWTLDESDTERLSLKHPYFENAKPELREHQDSYVETDADGKFEHVVTGEFNHGLGEIVQALLDTGMQITMLKEHDSLPWKHLPSHMRRHQNGEWTLTERRERLPHSYTLQAWKPA